MTSKPYYAKQFKRDYKLAKKRGKDIAKLDELLGEISAGTPLKPYHKPHRLQGDWKHALECHVESDWLLIWESKDDESYRFLRTGIHSDIFGE